MSEITVEMDEFGLITNPNDQLITKGVSTCIAFIVNGFYSNEEDESVPFAALYHWSGFGAERDPNGHTKEVFKRFLKAIRTDLELDSREPITLTNLHFVGGEKEQYSESGQLEVSGTEKEVKALIHTIKHFGFNKRCFIIAAAAIKHSHFLTKNDDSIDITLQVNRCEFRLDQPNNSEELSHTMGPK